jgi:FlaA1/EpsC-like NDP-sugar epimerase
VLVQGLVDSWAWALGLLGATLLRLDLDLSRVPWAGLVSILPLALLAQLLGGVAFGLYTGRWRFGSFDEVAALVPAAALASALLFGLNMLVARPAPIPRSVPIGGGLAALVLMAGARYGARLVTERDQRCIAEGMQRTLVFGAGVAGARVITAMFSDPGCEYLPVALLDDDPAKRKLRISGVPVVGTRESLAEAKTLCRAEILLIAIPSAPGSVITELAKEGTAAGLAVKVLPPVSEILGDVRVDDIRDVTSADLLGRHEVRTDFVSIASYLTGRRVLVTGAGGSIGSELCRQVHRLSPAQLVMVDRDESALHAVQLSIEGRALLDSPGVILCDLRDSASVWRLIDRHRPDVIFHAAALKHLPLLERHPAEAVRTNVWGTLDLLEAAAALGVERFVNISTDKAANPSSVLGYSKRIAERLTAYFANGGRSATYLSVRFGNVLGSSGSVLSTFRAQIERGGPVTVTHPEVTRYFMTVEEAVELVVQAGAIGGPGEVLVLDMGEPVKIAEVARVLAHRRDPEIPIVFTGLRRGEKLHEDLFGEDEVDRRPIHPQISHVDVPAFPPALARALDLSADEGEITRRLAQLCMECPDYDFARGELKTPPGQFGPAVGSNGAESNGSEAASAPALPSVTTRSPTRASSGRPGLHAPRGNLPG